MISDNRDALIGPFPCDCRHQTGGPVRMDWVFCSGILLQGETCGHGNGWFFTDDTMCFKPDPAPWGVPLPDGLIVAFQANSGLPQ